MFDKLNTLNLDHTHFEVWEVRETKKNVLSYKLEEISEDVYCAYHYGSLEYAGTYYNLAGQWYECSSDEPVLSREMSEEEKRNWEGLMGYPSSSDKDIKKKQQKELRDMKQSLRFKIYLRDRFSCRICGKSPLTDDSVRIEIDHKLPIDRGGLTIEENLWTLCFDCNRGKGTLKIPDIIYNK